MPWEMMDVGFTKLRLSLSLSPLKLFCLVKNETKHDKGQARKQKEKNERDTRYLNLSLFFFSLTLGFPANPFCKGHFTWSDSHFQIPTLLKS